MRKCKKCGETKSLADFYKQKGHREGVPDYVRRTCKECERLRIYARRQDNLAAYRERERDRARALPAEVKRQKARDHYSKNRERVIARQLARRAQRLGAEAVLVERDEILERDNNRCRECKTDLRGQTWHLDHIVPLALGGTHTWGNLQALCAPCNWSKGARLAGQIALPVG
jgi:5-methylcytosine-specific restriction endonuclease McrA